ncbi:MAG: cobalamin-dependent protein [Bacillota bacterium]|nr:histidine kinase [Clostridia bacterium]
MNIKIEVTENLFPQIVDAIVTGDAFVVKELVEECLARNVKPDMIVTKSLIPAMETVSAKFQSTDFFIVDVIGAANAMQTGVEILKERFSEKDEFTKQGTVVIGTIEGDIHDLGKNIVALTLEGSGYKVCDLGVNVSPVQFVQTVIKHDAEVVCISSLLTVTMLYMKDVIEALKKAGLREKVKVIIGGTPVTQSFADKIGADGYVKYGTNVVKKIRELLGKEDKKKIQLDALNIFVEKYGSIFRDRFMVKLVYNRDNMVVFSNSEEAFGECIKCSKWIKEDEIYKGTLYCCPGGLTKIEGCFHFNGPSNERIICGPFLTNKEIRKYCTPSLEPYYFHQCREILWVLVMAIEFVESKINQSLLEQEIEEQRESVIRAVRFQNELNSALKEANYRSLQSQVNPHFLFNSLNCLARLAQIEEADKTEKFAYALSRTLRYILKNIKGTVRVNEEINMVKDYLFIQQVRFFERIKTSLHIEDSILEGRIPCMILQPIVENAVIHGLEPLEDGGEIIIRGFMKGKKIVFNISDNGIGISPEKLEEVSQLNASCSGQGHTTGLGLVNVHQRLQHYFGSEYGLEIKSCINQGTTVEIYLPYVP